MRISDFFQTLVANLDEGESEIALEEEDVYEAVNLLTNLVKLHCKEDGGGETSVLESIPGNPEQEVAS